jgi:hypothetical protein
MFRLVIRQTSIHGVDAEGEEPIEIGVERRKSQRFKEKIPVEGLQMTEIENNSMALGNGTVIECLGPDNLKQLVASGARPANTCMELLKTGLRDGRRVHGDLRRYRLRRWECADMRGPPGTEGEPGEAPV